MRSILHFPQGEQGSADLFLRLFVLMGGRTEDLQNRSATRRGTIHLAVYLPVEVQPMTPPSRTRTPFEEIGPPNFSYSPHSR